MTDRPTHDRSTDHPDQRSTKLDTAQPDATPNNTGPQAIDTDELSPGRAASSRGARGRACPSDELGAAVSRFRAKLAKLGREAIVDERLALSREQLAAAAVAELDRLTVAADEALAQGVRHQAFLRRELGKMQRLARQAPAGPGRESAEAQVAMLQARLVEVEL